MKSSASKLKRATFAENNNPNDDSKTASVTKSRFRKLLWSRASQAESSSSHDNGAENSTPNNQQNIEEALSPSRRLRRAASDSHSSRASPLAGLKHSWNDDGDYFMSEPSLSEDDGYSLSEPEMNSYRENSLIGTKIAEANGVFKTGSSAIPLSPSRDDHDLINRRGLMLSPGTLSHASFTSSPGNTSLSSKDMSPKRPLRFMAAQGEWESQLKASAGRRQKLANESLAMLQTPSLSRDEDDEEEENSEKESEKERNHSQISPESTAKASGTPETDDKTPVRGYRQSEHFMTPETIASGSKASPYVSELKDGKEWLENDVPQEQAILHETHSNPSSNILAISPPESVMSPEMLHFMSPQEDMNADDGMDTAEDNDSLQGIKIESAGKLKVSGSNEYDENKSGYYDDNLETKGLFSIDDEIEPHQTGGGGESSDATQQRTGAGADLSSESESGSLSPQNMKHSPLMKPGDHLSEFEGKVHKSSKNENGKSPKKDGDANARKETVEGTKHDDLSGADDEKTLERPRRKRIYSSGGAPSHRRTRSGDGAAVHLMTGRTEWIGMEIDKLPVPPPLDDENDDQDMVDEERYDEVPQMQQFPAGSSGSRGGMLDLLAKHRRGNSGGTAGDMSADSAESSSSGQIPSFAMGAPSGHGPARAIRRLRQQQKQRHRLKGKEKYKQDQGSPGKDADLWVLSDSTVDFDDEPPKALSGIPSPDHGRVRSGDVPSVVERRHRAADSVSTLGGFGPENDNSRDTQGRVGEEDFRTAGHDSPSSGFDQSARQSSRASLGEGSECSSQGSKSSAFSWISSRISVLSGKANSLPRFFTGQKAKSPGNNGAGGDNSAYSGPGMGEDDSSGESVSSESDIEKFAAETKRATNPNDLSPPASKSTRYPGHRHSPRSEEQPQKFESLKKESSFARRHQERIKQQESERIRKLESHMETLSNTTSRASYKPAVSVPDDEMDKYPTYICPRCHTRQREFFSVATAPRQFDGPAGYLAFYFAVYVLASLFIFGLEEGWPALECVYFAVITLTTAGLGDYVPTTSGAKIICSVFIYFGVACIGLLLGSLLASSLDDASRKAARENQIANCPNCERILAGSKTRRRRSAMKSGNGRYFSERQANGVSFVDCRPSTLRGSKRHKTENGYVLEPQLSRITETTERTKSTDLASATDRSSGAGSSSSVDKNELDRGNSSDSDRKSSDANESSNENSTQQHEKHNQFLNLSPRFGVDQSMPGQDASRNVIDAYSASYRSPEQQNQEISSPFVFEPPSPGGVLHRQSHTRHMSFDIQNMAPLPGPQFTSSKTRSYSEENAHQRPAHQRSFSESLTFADRAAAADYSQYPRTPANADEDDESDSFSTDSRFSDELDEPREISRFEAAKYVILILRQALANSIFIIAIGSFGFYFIERMTPVDSFYFTTVLLTTVGYGDIVPKTSEGKMFATVYVLVAGTVLLHNMSMISMIPLELRRRRIEHAVLTQFGDHLDDAALRELATGNLIRRLRLSTDSPIGLSECTREMFALAMLVRLGRVTARDVRATFDAFQRLDQDRDGKLNSRDIIAGQFKKSIAIRQSMIQNSGNEFGSSGARKSFLFGSWLRQNSASETDNRYPQTATEYEFGRANQNDELSSEKSPLLQSPVGMMGNGNPEMVDDRLDYTTSSDVTEQHPLLRHRVSVSSMVSSSSGFNSTDNGGGTYMSAMSSDSPGMANYPMVPMMRTMSSDSYLSGAPSGNDLERGYIVNNNIWSTSPNTGYLSGGVPNAMQMNRGADIDSSPNIRKRTLYSTPQNSYHGRDF